MDQDRDELMEHDAEAEAILDKAPWATANTDPNLPDLAYLFECVGIAGQMSAGNNGKKPKLMIVMRVEVLQPLEHAGRLHWERFTVGIDGDEYALKPQTYDASSSIAATNIHKILKVVGGTTWRDIKDKRFMAQTRRDGNFTNLVGYCKEGELTPGVATPPRNFSKKRGGGVASDVAPDANTLIPCMNCNHPFPQSEVAAHMATCTGVATPDNAIPF